MTPETLKYTRDHEWIGRDGDAWTVGITDYAQKQLGDITFVELPQPGRTVKAGESVAVVESVKAASDIFSPVAGTVTAVNAQVENAPEQVNRDPYGRGWLWKMRNVTAGELAALMTAEQYAAFTRNAT
jgi:glycine cleavage system H protein